METALDLIGDMRDDLYRSTAEISAAFFLQNGPVNLTGCDIGIFRQTFVDKTLIMSKVQSVSAPSSVTNTSPCWIGFIVPGSILI